MRIYVIKDDNQRYLLVDVHLQDGFYPCVGGNGESDSMSLPPMEPAIWCKVMILESIVIDCDHKTLRWSTTDDAENDSQHVYSLNEECSGYDDEDELLDLARTVINKPHEGDGDSKMSILRMLHCFILPKVAFNTRDMSRIEQAKLQQIQYIDTLSAKLETKCFDTSDCQEKLDTTQEQFLPDIDKLISNGQCSKQFLEMLLCDLVEQEKRVRDKIAKAQDRYAELVPTQVSALKRSSRELFDAREERDFLDKKLVLVLKAREEIIDRKEDLPEMMDSQPNIILQDYIAKRYELQGLKEETSKLTQQQCCALSVREMVDTILHDLHEHGYSKADDADARGARPTDVLQTGLQPEWQKLSERVATIVFDAKHPVGISFEKFCSEIHDMCQQPLCKGREGDRLKFKKSSFYVSLEPQEIVSDGDYRRSYESTAMSAIIIDPYQDTLFQVNEKISHHLEKATKILSEHFNRKDLYFQNKLRLAYESCLYDREHESIHQLYEHVHRTYVEDIERDILRIKETFPVNLLSLPLRIWWHGIFNESPLNTGGSPPEMNAVSGGSPPEMNGHYDDDTSSDDDEDGTSHTSVRSARSLFINAVKDCCKGLNSKHVGSLSSLIDEWDTKAKPITESLERSLSIDSENTDQETNPSFSQGDKTFEDHFGPALQHMKDIFEVFTPLAKLKHMTSSIQIISSKVSGILKVHDNRSSLSNTLSDDKLLPLLVLMMLQLDTSEAASMWTQLVLLNDFMAPWLIDSCHGNTLEKYQRAHTILANLWLELSYVDMHCTINGVSVSKTG